MTGVRGAHVAHRGRGAVLGRDGRDRDAVVRLGRSWWRPARSTSAARPGLGLGGVLDAREEQPAGAATRPRRTPGSGPTLTATWPPNHGSMSVGQRLLAVGRLADELVERLVELGRERGLVVEAREGRHDLGELGLLAAREVEPELRVDDAVRRRPGEDVGVAAVAASAGACARRGAHDEQRHDERRDPAQRGLPAARSARLGRRDGRGRPASGARPSGAGAGGGANAGIAGSRPRAAARVAAGPRSAARSAGSDPGRSSSRPPCLSASEQLAHRGARPPLPDSCFMSFCISPNCFTSRLTSGSVVPEPGGDAAPARAR